MLLLATQLRGLVGAIWLGTKVEGSLGLQAALRILTHTLVVDLAFLVIAALVIFAAAGRKREIGRSFDLACVAALPLLFVDLVTSIATTALDLELTSGGSMIATAVAFGWCGVIVALAIMDAHSRRAVEGSLLSRARRAGWVVGAVAMCGIAVQGIWLVGHLEGVRPMTQGDPAPQLFLPHIGKNGDFTSSFDLHAQKGKVVVLDFWATWCNPCLKSMPHLDELQRKHPEIAVVAINMDDPAEARALFDERGYSMQLVYGDQPAADRYGVQAIPHTVVIDRSGVVRRVFRGGGADLESTVNALLK